MIMLTPFAVQGFFIIVREKRSFFVTISRGRRAYNEPFRSAYHLDPIPCMLGCALHQEVAVYGQNSSLRRF